VGGIGCVLFDQKKKNGTPKKNEKKKKHLERKTLCGGKGKDLRGKGNNAALVS